MSGRFAGLKSAVPVSPAAQPNPTPLTPPVRKNPREGKKAVVGYFTPNVSRALHQLALDTDNSIQGLLGEAIDDLMRKHGKHPFGER